MRKRNHNTLYFLSYQEYRISRRPTFQNIKLFEEVNTALWLETETSSQSLPVCPTVDRGILMILVKSLPSRILILRRMPRLDR